MRSEIDRRASAHNGHKSFPSTAGALASAIAGALDMERVRRRAEALTANGINYGDAAFARNAAICEGYLRESGFRNVETISIPCDGRTAHLDCVMPQSWDRTGRSYFEIVSPGVDPAEAMVCDTDVSPFAIGMWSPPTPKGGVTAEIVDWDSLDSKNPDVEGRIVLVFRPDFMDAYRACCDRRAAAILMCDGARPDITVDGYRWCNGIRRIGWYHVRRDPRCVFFNITPRKASWIRGRLAAGERLVGHGVASTRIFDGSIRTVTGVIPGKSRREVILCAHIYEPFIADDDAGAAQAIEVATALRDLSAKGLLPPLRHTIRVIIMMELYGFSQWFENPARARRAIHVFSFDSTCHLTLDAEGFRHTTFRKTVEGCPSFTDWLVLGGLSRARKTKVKTEMGCLSDDTFMSIPLIDVPSNWIHSSVRDFHHNSLPLFYAADWTAARNASAALGAAAAALATFGSNEAEAILPDIARVSRNAFRDLADGIVSDVREGAKKGASQASFALDKLSFFLEAEKRRLSMYGRFFGAKKGVAEARAALDAIADRARKAIGTPPFPYEEPQHLLAMNMEIRPLVPGLIMSQARVPWAKRVPKPGFPDYEIVQAYCDGKGTLFDAIRKCEFVTGHRFSGAETRAAIKFFRLMARCGYFEIKARYRTTPSELCETLRGLGVVPGAKVMLHSSFSALGEMRGGPEAVARALMRLVTPKGLLMMPAFSFFDYGPSGIFDPASTPSRCGALTEAFRKMPGVLRSLNPSNSFAAWGEAADEYISRHHEVSVMGADSPLGKLERDGGLIVMIQCPPSATFMHVVEFTNNVKCFDIFGDSYPVRFPDGSVRMQKTWTWRDGLCVAGELDRTWRLMRERRLVKTARFANALILAYRPADFRACHEEVLRGPGGCANCPIMPQKPKSVPPAEEGGAETGFLTGNKNPADAK